MEFDETTAVRFINDRLPEGVAPYPDDEILNVIDMIWDFYESNGMLEIDVDDDDFADDVELDLIDYVTKMLRRDKEANINPDHVPAIVRAELQYENSLLDS